MNSSAKRSELPGDRLPAHLVAQLVIGPAQRRAVVDELKAGFLDFLDHEHGVHAPAVLGVVRLHVAARVIDDAVQAARLQRVERRLVHGHARLGREVVVVAKRDDEIYRLDVPAPRREERRAARELRAPRNLLDVLEPRQAAHGVERLAVERRARVGHIELAVLGDHGADDFREPAREWQDLDDPHVRPQAEELELLHRLPLAVARAFLVRAYVACHRALHRLRKRARRLTGLRERVWSGESEHRKKCQAHRRVPPQVGTLGRRGHPYSTRGAQSRPALERR